MNETVARTVTETRSWRVFKQPSLEKSTNPNLAVGVKPDATESCLTAKSVPGWSRRSGFPARTELGSGEIGCRGTVAGSALAARLPAAGQIVVLHPDAEVGDLVAQGIAMDAERAGGAAEVAPVRFERSHDELPFELPPRLF